MAIFPENLRGDSTQIEITIEQSQELKFWVRTLQKALTVEAESGFVNVHGRLELFHKFISRSLVSSHSNILPLDVQEKLKIISDSYQSYETLPLEGRRRLVIDSRQYLYKIRNYYELSSPVKPPSLTIDNRFDLSVSQKPAATIDLSIESPLSLLQGIGPKLLEKLSSIGLFCVRDLIFHFPRDYVDYSSLKRINGLDPGETVTIVGSVRRCNSFISPKNPNLSILELHISDSTGRIKVTKFFAGRRQANKGFLKMQERLYPVNSTVAVSGLVKESKYGRAINDPIIEVLESPTSIVKSSSIGRLIPIYSLTEGLSSDRFRKIVEQVLPLTRNFEEPLPFDRLKLLGLPTRSNALFQIHCPKDSDSLSHSRRRLVFDEFLLLQLSLLSRRNEQRHSNPPPYGTFVLEH